ncbi:hypothetical protein [Actinocorallia longicatena]|uniref:Uncharacterized protein n=1 Tax=Actinocorallia longicatena TaxID=111803 RepID=A0ABP6QLU6_9ACTN
MIRTAAVCAAAAMVATSISAPAASASARQRCVVGTWKLTKASLRVDSASTHLRITGGAGAVLRFDGATATHSFARSKKLGETGTTGNRKVVGWLLYRRSLSVPTRVSGSRLVGNVARAGGGATLKLHQSRPLTYDPAAQSVVTLLQSGEFSGIPYTAAFSCKARALKLTQRVDYGGRTLRGTWTYRRA